MDPLVTFLKKYHLGVNAAITAPELTSAGWGSPRQIRRKVHAARKNGFPVCSSGEGYFYPHTNVEKSLCKKRLVNMGRGIFSVVKALKPIDSRQINLFELG